MSEINDRKDPEWLKLRKQKIAYEARLRNRLCEKKRSDRNFTVDQVMKATVNLTIAMLPQDKVSEFMAEIDAKVPLFSSTTK